MRYIQITISYQNFHKNYNKNKCSYCRKINYMGHCVGGQILVIRLIIKSVKNTHCRIFQLKTNKLVVKTKIKDRPSETNSF